MYCAPRYARMRRKIRRRLSVPDNMTNAEICARLDLSALESEAIRVACGAYDSQDMQRPTSEWKHGWACWSEQRWRQIVRRASLLITSHSANELLRRAQELGCP
jgi:hypothetical protein